MSDYLGSLVTRSAGSVEGVRPRLASLFESPRGISGALFGADAEPPAAESSAPDLAAPAFVSGAPEPAVTPRAPVEPALPRASATPLEQQPPFAPIIPQLAAPGIVAPRAAESPLMPPAIRAAQPAPEPAPRPAPVAPAPPLQPAAPPPRTSALAEQRGVTERVVIERSVPAELRSPSAPAALSALAPSPLPAPSAPLRASDPADQRSRGVTERVVIERSAPAELRSPTAAPALAAPEPPARIVPSRVEDAHSAPPAAQPPSRPAPGAIVVQPRVQQRAEPTQVEAAPEPPVVHVTIGRIEVRAAPPAPTGAPQRPRAAPPVMSLDDYLRQRAKRGSG